MDIISAKDSKNNDLSLDIDSSRLKHIFYMLHGEPTTRTKSFEGAVLVTKYDVSRLVDALVEQLKLLHIRDYTMSVGVGFENEIIEKPFEDFRTKDWSEPDKTTEVIIRVNFMYEDYDSGNPLKHSMFLRIAKGIKPGNFLQLLASNDNDSLDNLEHLMCPVFCRTDHVNDKVSKILMSVVSDWHGGQKQPRLLSGTYEFLRKHKRYAAMAVHYSFPASIVFILCYLAYSVPVLMPDVNQLPTYVAIIITSKVFVSIFSNIGGTRANTVYKSLSKISNEDVIFDITRGDNKEYSEVVEKNKDLFKSARSIFVWTNIQAVAASIVAGVILELFKP